VDADEQPLGDVLVAQAIREERKTAVSRWVRASPE
jgi:hypothetical protein